MGINMIAFIDKTNRTNDAFSQAFVDAGLERDFRYCKVFRWHEVVESCLGWEDLFYYSWAEYAPDKVAEWLETAKTRAQTQEVLGLGLDHEKFLKWLEICVENGAGVGIA